MPEIQDKEFGKVVVRRAASASAIRIKLAPSGKLQISAPLGTPLFFIKQTLNVSRSKVRQLLDQQRPKLDYQDGAKIGKSHTLIIEQGSPLSIERKGLRIILKLPSQTQLSDPAVQDILRPQIIDALRREAKSYLPKRLDYLAKKFAFEYQKVRFSHASSRWGSCTNRKTISLNIALMKLPFELIDYVIIHELAHTKHLNHSAQFWQEVERHDPDFKQHRARLKREAPAI